MMIAVSVLVLIYLSHGAFASPSVLGPEYLDMLRATGQDSEFARLMGIEDPSLVRATEVAVGEISEASHLGDILLTPEQLEQSRQGINFQRYPGSKWIGGVIPYWISSDFSRSQKSHINSAIASLNSSVSKLNIRPYRSGDKDYVMTISGRGCYSNLGKVGGQQTISLQSNGCLRTGTIQHEFIHAAGFLHEHMRPDRDNYIRILPENIPDEWEPQYEKASSTDFGNQEKYDYYSVMHYPVEAPGTGLPAFEVFDSSIDKSRIGQRAGPTQRDINKINTLYA